MIAASRRPLVGNGIWLICIARSFGWQHNRRRQAVRGGRRERPRHSRGRSGYAILGGTPRPANGPFSNVRFRPIADMSSLAQAMKIHCLERGYDIYECTACAVPAQAFYVHRSRAFSNIVGIGGSLANHRTRADLRTGRCARDYELMHLATLPMAA